MKLELDMEDLRKDLRSIGVAIIVASVVSGLFEEKIPLELAFASLLIGVGIWIAGLVRKEDLP